MIGAAELGLLLGMVGALAIVRAALHLARGPERAAAQQAAWLRTGRIRIDKGRRARP